MSKDRSNMPKEFLEKVRELHELVQRVARHTDLKIILKEILNAMVEFSNADGGTLYSLTGDDHMQVDVGNIKEPGANYLRHMATYVSMSADCENISNIYDDDRFTPPDEKLIKPREDSYVSLMALPLMNLENVCIGVIQLVRSSTTSFPRPFKTENVQFANMLASQGAMILYNAVLRNDQDKLFESFVSVIADAIDDKSKYTGGHCERVPKLTLMLADAAVAQKSGVFKDFDMDDTQRREVNLAAQLHDCGKITTPVHIVDKATKLETIFDRIDLVNQRFEIVSRDKRIEFLENALEDAKRGKFVDEKYEWQFKKYAKNIKQMKYEIDFLKLANTGGEFMKKEYQQRVYDIQKSYVWTDLNGKKNKILTDDEVRNLVVSKGTLTDQERKIINHHIEMTISMLNGLHLPKDLQRIPEIAGGHHEKMDGSGYPNGLTRDQMSLEARIMGLADIFEALTAPDRPYKKGKTLSEALKILGFMMKDNHIDEEIFNLFIDNKIYMKYSLAHVDPAQIDEVDILKIPGYISPEKRTPKVVGEQPPSIDSIKKAS